MDFAAQLSAYRLRVEQGIDELLPPSNARPARLHEAMRYAMLGGGKRLRPVLTLASAETFGAKDDAALVAAVALECVHTYSLVHDDLPCMDNDDLRRGRPTVHRQFDEATAVLAGDALLTHAFFLLTNHYTGEDSLMAARLVQELAWAAGSQRLIGGQQADLLAEKKAGATAAELDFIHHSKTAAMIEAALVMGGIVGRASAEDIDQLRTMAGHLGLAFQIIDDILDATADTATLGKTAGKDARAGKVTYVKLHGIEASRCFAQDHTAAALKAVRQLPGDTGFLVELVRQMAKRDN
jgi:geranylgeranyl diphosphate synthase type II